MDESDGSFKDVALVREFEDCPLEYRVNEVSHQHMLKSQVIMVKLRNHAGYHKIIPYRGMCDNCFIKRAFENTINGALAHDDGSMKFKRWQECDGRTTATNALGADFEDKFTDRSKPVLDADWLEIIKGFDQQDKVFWQQMQTFIHLLKTSGNRNEMAVGSCESNFSGPTRQGYLGTCGTALLTFIPRVRNDSRT